MERRLSSKSFEDSRLREPRNIFLIAQKFSPAHRIYGKTLIIPIHNLKQLFFYLNSKLPEINRFIRLRNQKGFEYTELNELNIENYRDLLRDFIWWYSFLSAEQVIQIYNLPKKNIGWVSIIINDEIFSSQPQSIGAIAANKIILHPDVEPALD